MAYLMMLRLDFLGNVFLTLIFKEEKVSGGKSNKKRITVLVVCNMNNTEKLLLLVTGKYAKPCCFKSIKIWSTLYDSTQKVHG